MKQPDNGHPESERAFERMRQDNGVRRATRPSRVPRGNANRGVLGEGNSEDDEKAASGTLDAKKSRGSGER